MSRLWWSYREEDADRLNRAERELGLWCVTTELGQQRGGRTPYGRYQGRTGI